MANWANPTLTSTYTNFVTEVKARDEDLAKMFDGQTVSNLPAGAIRWSSANNRFEKWSGTAWGTLSATYAFTAVTATGTLTVGANADTGQTASITIGNGRTGNGFTSLDIIGDTTYTTYAVRLARFGTGANAETNFYHRGTGTFRMNCQDGGSWGVQISSTDRLVIGSDGIVSVPGTLAAGTITNSAGVTVTTGGGVSAAFVVQTNNTFERLRISTGGDFHFNTTAGQTPGVDNTNEGAHINTSGTISASRASFPALRLNRNGDGEVVRFSKSGAILTGNTINISGTVVNYSTSSDYRLKTFIEPVGDALARVLSVPVWRFAYRADPATIRDGWAAHELQSVAPYAVSGEKDGNEYQGVDYGKLVPLLWAAVQELALRTV